MKNSDFILGRVPITKEEVRAISLAKLDLKEGYNFMDIGSGTGSITVEAGLKNKGIRVTSIEMDQDAFELTRLNIDKFNIKNVVQIRDKAPITLKEYGLQDTYQAIFLGGSGDNLEEILGWSYKILDKGGKLVSNYILLENAIRSYNFMKKIGFKNIELIQVGVAVLENLGGGSYLKPKNPIIIISGEK